MPPAPMSFPKNLGALPHWPCCVSHCSNVPPSQKLGGTWLTTQISNVICGMWNNDQWLLISATSFHPGNAVDAGLGWFALISYVAMLTKAFLYWLQSVALYSGSCGLHRFPLKYLETMMWLERVIRELIHPNF